MKTTEIGFGSTKMEISYREKAFHAGKKSGKMTLPPKKNMTVTPLPTVHPVFDRIVSCFVDYFVASYVGIYSPPKCNICGVGRIAIKREF